MTNAIEIPINGVQFREDLYPRIERDPALVQTYESNLEVLPPIEVNQHHELIDGWHRWTAHKKRGAESIRANVTATKSESEFLALACRRNSTAGKQLQERDKRKMAVRLYNGGFGIEKEEIAQVLSVTLRSVRRFLTEVDEQLRVERREKILDLWLSCHSQEQISEAVGIDQSQVARELQDLCKTDTCPKCIKSAILHEDGFQPQIYSVWNFARATNAVRHFGNIPPEILDNLLYYYTKPFDVVFDPFAGGGMTIDVCKQRYRRYYVSDLNPIEERRHEIRQHDITAGLPEDLPVPDLVFLDPPYWKQAEHRYSEDPTDLANVDLDQFLDSIGEIAKLLKRRWKNSHPGKLALIIGPWKHDGRYVDLPFLCYQRISKFLPLEQRITVPYSTEIHGGAYVERAKQNKEVLYLTRDLMVFACE